jgi:hypothetical protein
VSAASFKILQATSLRRFGLAGDTPATTNESPTHFSGSHNTTTPRSRSRVIEFYCGLCGVTGTSGRLRL